MSSEERCRLEGFEQSEEDWDVLGDPFINKGHPANGPDGFYGRQEGTEEKPSKKLKSDTFTEFLSSTTSTFNAITQMEAKRFELETKKMEAQQEMEAQKLQLQQQVQAQQIENDKLRVANEAKLAEARLREVEVKAQAAENQRALNEAMIKMLLARAP